MPVLQLRKTKSRRIMHGGRKKKAPSKTRDRHCLPLCHCLAILTYKPALQAHFSGKSSICICVGGSIPYLCQLNVKEETASEHLCWAT